MSTRTTAVSLTVLGQVLSKKGEAGPAEQHFGEALAMQQACAMLHEAHGTNHWMSGYCGGVYGAFLTDLGRYDEAEELLVGSYAVLRDTLGPEHRRTTRALKRLVELYEAWDKPGEAAEYRALLPVEDDPEG